MTLSRARNPGMAKTKMPAAGDLHLEDSFLRLDALGPVFIMGCPRSGTTFLVDCVAALSRVEAFTGILLLGKETIRSEYVHMGFPSPTSFITVLKFEFKDGTVVSVEDVSKDAREARERGDPKGYQPVSDSPEDISDWVRKRFSLDPSI